MQEFLITIGSLFLLGFVLMILSIIFGWKKSVFFAYLIWFFGGFGVLGFHRFYIGKIGTGLLWLFTGGVLGIGALIDLFTLGVQVGQYNQKIDIKRLKRDQEM